jgi:guanylate kinase
MTGNLFVIGAPSGAGKTSLVDALLKHDQQLILSISNTTRAQRPGEQNGVHYNFVSTDEFKQLIAQNALLEYANVYDNYYGTSKIWVMEQLQSGKDVVLEIDWQGAEQIKKLYPSAVMIFVFPPSRAILEERLKKRGQDSAEVIAKRLSAASVDIAHSVNFDYWVLNQDFNVALGDLQAIIHAQRLRQNQQQEKYQTLLAKL